MSITSWIDIVRYSRKPNESRTVSVDETSVAEWAIVFSSGTTQRGFTSKAEALDAWNRIERPVDAYGYLVKICASVTQEGTLYATQPVRNAELAKESP
jgi:hypothetical protein